MDKIYRRRLWTFVPALFSFGIAFVLFWAAFALFVGNTHIGWAWGMLIVALLVGIPSVILAVRLLRFRVTLRYDSLIAPKIRPLGIKIKNQDSENKKISELNTDLRKGEKTAFEVVSGIFDNKLFGGRYKMENVQINFSDVESFDVARIQTSYNKYIFLIFNYRDGTKRVIEVRPLGDKKAKRLVEEITQYVKKGETFKQIDGMDNFWATYLAIEGGFILGEIIVALIACCCEGL